MSKKTASGNSRSNKNAWAGLTPNQKKFTENYHKNGNAKQSYLDAGYKAKGKSAESNAHRLMGNDGVRAYLNFLQTKVTDKHIATSKELQQKLTQIGMADLNLVLEQDSGGNVELKEKIDFNLLDGVTISKSETATKHGTSVSTSISIKLSNQVKAITELVRLRGYGSDKNPENENIGEDAFDRILVAVKRSKGKKR